MTLLECIPNFSEGRRAEVLDALVAAVAACERARVLDASRDPDHHRAVVTFAAPPGDAAAAAFEAVRTALERIDVTRHAGVHPRIGAADVVPFVPLAGAGMQDAAAEARALGARLGGELELPVFLYGAASPTGRSLPAIRRGGRRALAARMAADPDWRPDFGPAELHPTGGAVAVGARELLIAFNIELESRDLGLAREIAGAIRERDGGLAGVRALGLELASAGCVQVSVNVCDVRATSLTEVYAAVERLAGARGAAVRASELVGLAPRCALDAQVAARVRLRDFDARRHILEERL